MRRSVGYIGETGTVTPTGNLTLTTGAKDLAGNAANSIELLRAPRQKGAHLSDITKEFSREEACIEYLEQLRWPNGVECLKCADKKISRITSIGKTGKPRHLYQCLICRTQFTVRTGTIFRDSHLPLTHWFKAIALVCGSKRTINVTRLQRELNVQYRTASYLLLRIHRAIESGGQLEDRVTSATNDPNPSNNAHSESTTVQPGADLSLTKTDSADPVKPGAPFTYILAVNNAGPDTALNVVVTDTLPVGVTFLSASGNHWKCTLSFGTVTCTRPDLNVGGPKDITIAVTAPSQPGTIVNTASVTSATNDPNPANNAASESTTVQ